MATNYYKPYEIYDISLSKGTGIVQSASSLKSSCANQSKTIKSNFINKISDTNWSEEGKKVVESNILPGLESNIQGLTDFISNNLYKACDISINHLLPKVIMIKEKNIELDSVEKDLIKTEKDLENLRTQEPSATKTDDATGEEIVNPDYEEWVTEVNTLTTTYNELVTRFNNLETLLKSLCQEANNLIANILSLNGNLSAEEISAMLPSIDSVDQSNYDYLSLAEMPTEFVHNNFFDENGQLILPEGFENITKENDGKIYYGLLEDGSGYIAKVKYTDELGKSITGTLYIPLDNPTSNFGLIMLGGDDKNKYTSRTSYILQDNDFDSVVFIPNHLNDKGSIYTDKEIELLSESISGIMEQYSLTTINGYSHSNGNAGMSKLMSYNNDTSIPNFSSVIMHAPSTAKSIEDSELLEKNNVQILIGKDDSYYEKYKNSYPDNISVVVINENLDLYDDRDNNKKFTSNNHSCNWLTYGHGEFIDNSGEKWDMIKIIDGN